MKISKRQLKRIIQEATSPDADRFKDIMDEIGELVDEAWEIAGRPEAARGYWYNGILGRIDAGEYGIGFRGITMSDTLIDLGGEDEDMMQQGYNDGMDGKSPAHEDNEYYMVNYKDGVRDQG